MRGRTEKQCRLRYLKYLQPILKRTEWTPNEDAVLFHLVNSIGKKWGLVAKLLTGKTEDATKNRYQFIRGKMENLLTLAPASGDREAGEISPLLDSQDMNEKLRAAVDAIINIRNGASSPPSNWCYDYDFTFGPYLSPSVVHDAICKRCALAVPSSQTGRKVCSKTGKLSTLEKLVYHNVFRIKFPSICCFRCFIISCR